ncbi:MAG: hypothetical protein BHW64_01730 [Candidatus Melainabacteria bacterium LEY3_CP_29_8]|nr:MAG: hypothetical protein BHW64_01730 [Candidatus Melainabacteria bacterium LEY3_CP_29_8]
MEKKNFKGINELNALRGKVPPMGVEKVLNNMRLQNDFIEIVERKFVEEKVDEAKKELSVGKKAIISISPLLIHVPDWQRDMETKNTNEIANRFNPYMWELPKLMYKNGRLYVVDGEHRIIGTIKAGLPMIQCEILFGITEDEAIDLFLNQGDSRRNVSPYDKYNAALEAKKPEYIKLKEICNKNHVAVKGDRKPIENPIGILTPISDGVNLVKSNPQLLDRILYLIGELKWNAGKTVKEGKAYSAKVIRNLKSLYAYYPGREMEMENILLNNCKGSQYFNDNLVEKWQDTMFDFLNGIIEQNIDIPNVSAKSTPKTRRKKTA